MAYINQYNDSGTLYNLQDKRFEDITSSTVGMVPVATADGDFELQSYSPSKARGNLSLEKQIHYLTTAVRGQTPYQYYVAWNDLTKWKGINFAASGYFYLDGSEFVLGGMLASADGYNYVYETTTDADFYRICGGSTAIIASTYSETPAIYYRTTTGTWTQCTGLNFTTSMTGGGYFDLSYSQTEGRFIASPHCNSNEYAYSRDGITWTMATLPSTKNSSIICGNNSFVYYSIEDSSALRCYYSIDGINWIMHNTQLIPGAGTIGQNYIYYDGQYYYLVIKGSTHVCLYMGIKPTELSLRENLDSRTSPQPSILTTDTIKSLFVANNYLFIWTGGTTINRCNLQANLSVWEELDLAEATNPAESIIAYNNVLYQSATELYIAPSPGQIEKANVWTSSNNAKTWEQGTYEYTLSQATESEDDEDTTTIVMNLLRRTTGEYEIGGNDTRSYRQTFNATTDWVAATSPSTEQYIVIGQATHNCGTSSSQYTDLLIDVYTTIPQSGPIVSYAKYYGFPSTGWRVEIDTTGNVKLIVPNENARFKGAIVIK